MRIVFNLTMPNVGSWNGVWTGKRPDYNLTKQVSVAKAEELDGQSWYYNFGDGWGASVSARVPTKGERIRSAGFCGYNWMVDSILSHGKILNAKEMERENATV